MSRCAVRPSEGPRSARSTRSWCLRYLPWPRRQYVDGRAPQRAIAAREVQHLNHLAWRPRPAAAATATNVACEHASPSATLPNMLRW
eukprot:scaffold56153_cov24-Phaeocystis_antarctica.AAC.1